MNKLSYICNLSLFQRNRTKNLNMERPKMLNFIARLYQSGWGISVSLKGVDLSIPSCQFISNRSVMNVQS